MQLSNGDAVEPNEGELAQVLMDRFKGYPRGLVRIGRRQCLMPQPYTRWAQQYLDFKVRSSDIVVATYPKCGTTWMQEIIWTMVNNPDLNHPEGDTNLSIRSPFLEFDSLVSVISEADGHNPTMVAALAKLAPGASPDDGLFLKLAEAAPDTRIIKTHLPMTLLPANMLDTCKVVYVARNPKDGVCSFLHHHRRMMVHDFQGTDEQFVDHYCRGELLFGSYADNLADAWSQKDHKNMLILFYEDLQRDIIGELNRLSNFLGTNLSAKQLQNVAQRTTFKDMKQRMVMVDSQKSDAAKGNEAIVEGHGAPGTFDNNLDKKAGFYRKGQAGAWRVDLDPKLAEKIDKWTEKNVTERLGITFLYGD